MQSLADATMLELWEQGRRRHPLDRALLFLGAAYPEEPFDHLADLPVGSRDAAILELRCATFGSALSTYLDCPRCGERLEFQLDAVHLLQDKSDGPGREPLEVSGTKFRLPTSRDLARIAALPDEDEAAKQLARLCMVEPNADDALNDTLLKELEERFSQSDPVGNIQLDFRCPACDHTWDEAFDIGEFLWEEIETKAKALLQEVHHLARAYGWSEGEILSLSPERRAFYLEMVS